MTAHERVTMKNEQRWECVPCRRSVLVVFHTSERQCKCGRPMGLVLFGTTDKVTDTREAKVFA